MYKEAYFYKLKYIVFILVNNDYFIN